MYSIDGNKPSADSKALPAHQDSLDLRVGPVTDIILSDRELEIEHALNNYVPDTDEEKRFVRKLDLILMPTLWFMYILAYIDRQNIVSVFYRMHLAKTVLKISLGKR